MINGVDLIGFFLPFGGGFLVGVFLGIVIAVMMNKSDKENKE